MNKKLFIECFMKNFAPNISNKVMKKYKIHETNYLWLICNCNLVPHLSSDDARKAYNLIQKNKALLIDFDTDNETSIISAADKTSEELENCAETYIVSQDFSWAYIVTHETNFGIGPYFIENKINQDKTKRIERIKSIIDKYDPIGLLKMGCPEDEYIQESIIIEKRLVNGLYCKHKIIKEVFLEQFDEKINDNICKKIAYDIACFIEFDDFTKDFYEDEKLKDKITNTGFSISLKVHDDFVIESVLSEQKTYINGKFYHVIEEQDLLDSFYDFIDKDYVYIQYRHKHLFLPFLKSSHFKEVKK